VGKIHDVITGHGRDIHNPAMTLFEHSSSERLASEKYPTKIDRNNLVERGGIHIFSRNVVLRDSCARNYSVDPARPVENLLGGARDAFWVSDVDLDEISDLFL
jgi:hypothetical protein